MVTVFCCKATITLSSASKRSADGNEAKDYVGEDVERYMTM
jgi:hypothetical protein